MTIGVVMTKSLDIGDSTVIWPEQETDDDYHYEHAILVQRCSDSIELTQRDQRITIPKYALRAVLAAMRE